MDEQVFIDGIGMISIIGGTVRLDLVTYSPTEKDAKGQPALAFHQRLVMGADGFLRAAEKIQETVNTLQRLAQQQRPRPVPAPEPAAPVDPVTIEPAPSAPVEVHVEPVPAPAPRRPFP